MSWFLQLRLLLWKNFLLKWRHPIATLMEIGIPLAAFGILIIIRSVVKTDYVQEAVYPSVSRFTTDDTLPMLSLLACGRDYSDNQAKSRYPYQAIALSADIPSWSNTTKNQFLSDYENYFKQSANYSLYYPRNKQNNPLLEIDCWSYDNWDILHPDERLNAEDYLFNKNNQKNQSIFKVFDSENDINDYLQIEDYSFDRSIQTLYAAIIFTEIASTTNGDLSLSYTIRLNSSDTPWTGLKTNTLVNGYDDDFYKYYDSHLLSMKLYTDRFLLAQSRGLINLSIPSPFTPDIDEVIFTPFPDPAHNTDNFASYINNILGMFLTAGFLWPFSRLVKNIVEEKEKRIKESMKMAGLNNSIFWLSWIITYAIMFIIMCALITGITKPSLFPNSESSVIFFFFLSFSFSLLTLACLTTTFFSRAKTAGSISPFILLGLYLPYVAVQDDTMAEYKKNWACLAGPVCLSLGSVNIVQLESAFIGAQWSVIQDPLNNFRVSTSIGLMFFDFFLYLLIACYLDLVWPSEFGTHLHPLFFIQPSFWKSLCRSNHNDSPSSSPPVSMIGTPALNINNERKSLNVPLIGMMDNHHDEKQEEHSDDIEPVNDTLRSQIGVKIRRLRKEFQGSNNNPVVAVDGLNLELYKGQICVLLGHNGAGKTTTIHMLTGMLPPSKGTATIFDRDIVTEMSSIRSFMGVCPQHDCLFDDLTVAEHLELYARLKGVSPAHVSSVVTEGIKEVQLEEKRDSLSKTLSGGQKRRLSLAIALIGDSRIVYLDEPTSGVDPFSRRAIWDVLTKKKEGRVIVLTTHFMDEADQLGDRIAIMHQGKLRCAGSSLFLKRKFGVGYALTFIKSPSASVDSITQLVKHYVDSSDILSQVAGEVSYRLPFSATPSFPALLTAIDEKKSTLNIDSYGLSVTTMEEVFLRVAQDDDHSLKKDNNNNNNDDHNDHKKRQLSQSRQQSEDDLAGMDALKASESDSYFSRHFGALISKRWNVTKRDTKAFCCQLLIPIILISVGLGLLRIPPDFNFPDIEANINSQYNLPFYLPVNSELLSSVQNGLHLDPNTNNNNHILEYYNTNDPIEFSYLLLQNRNQYQESRYGALFGGPCYTANISNCNSISSPLSFAVYSNMSAIHGLPTFMNLGMSSILRSITNSSKSSINLSIHPFSWTYRERRNIQSINAIFAAIIVSLGFSFIPASYAVFIVSERENKSKHLQLISGVSLWAYWLSNFFWDFISFLVPGSLSIFIIYLYGNPNFIGDNFPALILSFLFYALSVIPFTYMLSFLFHSHTTAQNVMILIYIVGGLILAMVSFALQLIPSTQEANTHYIRYLFRLIPNFCLSDSIFWLSTREFMKKGRYDLDITGMDYIFMGVESLIYFLITIIIEILISIPAVMQYLSRDPIPPPRQLSELDDDVKKEKLKLVQKYHSNQLRNDAEEKVIVTISNNSISYNYNSGDNKNNEEKQHINNNNNDDDIVRIEGLSKQYGSKVAVHDLWFSIPKGQCFGYLGVNGAGKTTTLKILTGDLLPSTGAAYLGGYDISLHPQTVRRLTGYCPQFDALHELLTGKEHLELYGRVRGIPEKKLSKMINYLIDRLTLTQYANRPAGTYSGGNKRKLSVAIALIGDPAIVFLDEPSTGVDPVSRRFMWDFISETMSHRAVVLTTHSMEEAEALCGRIGILVTGELTAIGSAQHLKNKYGKGYQLDISTANNDSSSAKQFIKHYFPRAEEIEVYGGKLKYSIPHQQGMDLKNIFALVENNKNNAGIAEYSIGQTTLEQVFIGFAKKGEEKLHEEYIAKHGGGVAAGGERSSLIGATGFAPVAGHYQNQQVYKAPDGKYYVLMPNNNNNNNNAPRP